MRQSLISRVAEWFCRRLIYVRFGRESVEADFILNYLDKDAPDWAGARRAWRIFALRRRDAAARKRRGWRDNKERRC